MLLLLDGYSSHYTLRLQQKMMFLILFYPSPNATHMAQLLCVSFVGSLRSSVCHRYVAYVQMDSAEYSSVNCLVSTISHVHLVMIDCLDF